MRHDCMPTEDSDGCSLEPVNDGGPAFPVEEKNDDGTTYHTNMGMSLRDWFAGQALMGLVLFHGNQGAVEQCDPDLASWSYSMADAMLREREKRRD